MKQNRLTFALILFLIVLVVAPTAAFSAEPNKATLNDKGISPQSPPSAVERFKGFGDSFTKMLEWLFPVMLSVAVVSAVAVIAFAGFWWIGAFGNPGRIQQSQEWIWNAIIGLVLALSSFLILKTINPDLVALRTPKGLEIPEGERPTLPTQAERAGEQTQTGQKGITKKSAEGLCVEDNGYSGFESLPEGGYKCVKKQLSPENARETGIKTSGGIFDTQQDAKNKCPGEVEEITSGSSAGKYKCKSNR